MAIDPVLTAFRISNAPEEMDTDMKQAFPAHQFPHGSSHPRSTRHQRHEPSPSTQPLSNPISNSATMGTEQRRTTKLAPMSLQASPSPSLSEQPFALHGILPGLYLSSFPHDILPRDIKYILNLSTQPHPPFPSSSSPSSHVEILHLPLSDIPDITPYLQPILKFILRSLQSVSSNAGTHPKRRSKVLVYCVQGVDVSAAAVVAFICYTMYVSSGQALAFLKSRKADVNPKERFLVQIDGFSGRESC
ncbi:uncharacterized protein RAG0_08554 [Rhynchosporium agropyri]|uniref:protein-tyrosine-phosphatase n=1 Tax=Rhynchosporium agropyri TaxID=914238 RepID=A0A1E1KUC3_9HELO|nr:uncharacterized protein RAG0_08554 [Rhynchosporium agropyri]